MPSPPLGPSPVPGALGQEVQLFAATMNEGLDVLCCRLPSPGMLPGQVSQCMRPSEHISRARWLGHAGGPCSPRHKAALFPWHVLLCCTRPAEHGPAPLPGQQRARPC